jgi:hypothetical protein
MQINSKNERDLFSCMAEGHSKESENYLSLIITLRLTRGELVEGLEKFPRFPNLRGREASPPKKFFKGKRFPRCLSFKERAKSEPNQLRFVLTMMGGLSRDREGISPKAHTR